MRPHENLNVWKRAVEYVLRIYTLTRTFPHDEIYALTSQMRRAAVSVAANIAEGAGRRSKKEFAHYLSNAQGSSSELATELLIAWKLGYVKESDYQAGAVELEEISRMMIGLSKRVLAPTHSSRDD
jgi:four helix bundle protein